MIIPRIPLTKENIFKRISSYDIFRFYSDNFTEIGKSFKSDLRSDDKVPSTRIEFIKGDLLYTDFGLGSFRALDFVMEKEGLSYTEALGKINADFNLGLGSCIICNYADNNQRKTATSIINPKFSEKQASIIKKKKRDFTIRDLEYWNSFYWTKEMLELSHTESISHYWINDNMWKVGKDELAFSYEYYFHNERMQRKLYFPEKNKEFKWLSNVDNTIVQLVDVMPKKGNILFITSSKKDAGIFWRMQIENMFPGLVIHGVAPNNEGSFVPEEWFSKQQKRWDRIILWYNNDWDKPSNPGLTKSIKFAEKYDIEWFVNPDNTPKDPSDYSKKLGLTSFKNIVYENLQTNLR